MRPGKIQHDVVPPTGYYLEQQINAIVFEKLDKSMPPHLDVEPPAMARHAPARNIATVELNRGGGPRATS